MLKILVIRLFALGLILLSTAVYSDEDPANTGVSGVYEVVIGTGELDKTILLLNQFGFKEVDRGALSAEQAQAIYGVSTAAVSVRLQNGDIDSHGLVRVIAWEELLSEGVGLAPPETIGVRMSVMRTNDIFRISDVFGDARKVSQEHWMLRGPVYDDLYGLDQNTKYNAIERRSGVREMGVYGAAMNLIFFQRYGYTIPGYGTVEEETPLKTSEFTHHDFFVAGDIEKVTQWYSSVLGFKAEADAVLDGEWQSGPRVVFDMPPGGTHWYKGFVSPNNICGKLKFFTSPDPKTVRDRSDRQALGHPGITMHTVWTPKIDTIEDLAEQHNIKRSARQKNEYGEDSLVLYGPDGSTWQVIQKSRTKNKPLTKLEFIKTIH